MSAVLVGPHLSQPQQLKSKASSVIHFISLCIGPTAAGTAGAPGIFNLTCPEGVEGVLKWAPVNVPTGRNW